VTDTHETSERPLLSADRLKAFTDGVVALALIASLRAYLRRHRELHDIPDGLLRDGIRADTVTVALFVVALVVALLVPQIGYFAMFLMILTGPAIMLVKRLERARRRAR
jgi:hypothetical protein